MKVLPPRGQVTSSRTFFTSLMLVVALLSSKMVMKLVSCRGSLSCELVVMGTRGRGAIHNMVLGSVATKVLHLVAVPVTLVK